MISVIDYLPDLLPGGLLPSSAAAGGRSEVIDGELTGVSVSYRALTGHLLYEFRVTNNMRGGIGLGQFTPNVWGGNGRSTFNTCMGVRSVVVGCGRLWSVVVANGRL